MISVNIACFHSMLIVSLFFAVCFSDHGVWKCQTYYILYYVLGET